MQISQIEKNANGYQILGVINFDTVLDLYKKGAAILESSKKEVTLSFGEVRHIDSSAIALLLSWLRVAKKKGKSFTFTDLPAQLIDIANVCEVMPMLENHIVRQNKERNHG